MSPKLYALLVGINRYSPQGPVPALRGCVADVQAVRELLINRLSVPAEQIHLLLDEQATRAAVIDAWRSHLRDQAMVGDFVFFHYSGHGSQARSNDPAEPDGYDESLVAYDSRDPGQYDVLDKELGALIQEVERKGAHVALVMDCCHSGHITRTLDGTRPLARQCPPDQRPRPPETVLSASSAVTRSGGNPAGQIDHSILLSACRDEEVANEYLPPVTRQWQGALTYFFLQTLQQTQTPITWTALYDRIYAQVRTSYPHQSPQLEGPGDRLLFGAAVQPSVAYLLVTEVQGTERIKLGAGAATGLVEGGQLALYAPGSNLVGRPLNTAMVAAVEVDHTWARLDRPGRIEPGSRARMMGFGYGDQQAVVAVTAPLVREAISVAAQGKPSPFLRPVSTTTVASNPDFFVVADRTGLLLQDAAGEPLLPEPLPLTPEGAAQIVQALEHLTIYRNVCRLRNPAAEPALRGAVTLIDPSPAPQSGRTGVAHPGEMISFRLHNQTKQPLYVAVLHLTSDYAIRRLFPDRGSVEKLAPGFKTLPIRVQAAPLRPQQRHGRELFKLFVTTLPATFDALRLPPLYGGNPHREAATRDHSPLGWLLNAVRRTGTRPIRPLADGADDQWFVEQFECTVIGPPLVETESSTNSPSAMGNPAGG